MRAGADMARRRTHDRRIDGGKVGGGQALGAQEAVGRIGGADGEELAGRVGPKVLRCAGNRTGPLRRSQQAAPTDSAHAAYSPGVYCPRRITTL